MHSRHVEKSLGLLVYCLFQENFRAYRAGQTKTQTQPKQMHNYNFREPTTQLQVTFKIFFSLSFFLFFLR